MRSSRLLKVVATAFILFAGVSIASAQSSGQVTTKDKQAVTDSKNHLKGADSKLAVQKMEQARAEAGYPAMPGFTFTGNPEADKANYRNAKEAFMRNDPAGYQKMINTPSQPSLPAEFNMDLSRMRYIDNTLEPQRVYRPL